MWKWIVGFVVVLVVLAGGGLAVVASQMERGEDGQMRFKFAAGEGPQGEPVSLASAEVGDLMRTVSAPGGIEPVTSVQISAQVSARIVGLPFREGDEVQEGDVVVRLDARDLSALVDSAEAQLKSAEAQLDGAKAEYMRAEAEVGRLRELFDTGDVSKSELDQAEAQFLSAQSMLRQAEQGIEIARATIQQRRKDLDNAIIAAPISGTIVQLNAEVGETVVVGTLNNAGSVIMEIADLSKMLLEAQVDEANIAPIKPGQQATVYVNAFPEEKYEGSVQRVGLKRQVGSDGVGFFQTEILVETDGKRQLLSGLTANTDIEVERFVDVIKVPSQAVVDRRVDELPDDVRENDPLLDRSRTFASVVYVEDEDSKTEARVVRTGPSDLTHTVITGGLEEGERVVVGPYKTLVDLRHDRLIRDRDAEDDEDDGETPATQAEGTDEDAESSDESDEDGAA